jgi:hypothetical protein
MSSASEQGTTATVHIATYQQGEVGRICSTHGTEQNFMQSLRPNSKGDRPLDLDQ